MRSVDHCSVALSAVSTDVNYAAQAKVQKARDDAMAAERIRQNTLDQEAEAVNLGSQDRFTDFEGQQDERGLKLADYFQGQEVAEPDATAAVPTSSSNITVKEEAKQRGQAKDFTNSTGAALGEPYGAVQDGGGGLKTAINGARRRSAIKDISPYTGRHSVSTQLVVNGIHPHIKYQILGHAADDM